ncbi:hypothetical protein EVAR_43915_1 [Eumeta japonica]|uniref:Uncharacterized protein n=1 Tax=Eumeta variegata TaxID=151549 RepID=A0A4C1WRH7_EUMVA|nr:hypothetical protein EVAR_43915_1 [Eumeta japonica]
MNGEWANGALTHWAIPNSGDSHFVPVFYRLSPVCNRLLHRAIVWSTWLQRPNGSVGPVKYHTLTECVREAAAFAVAIRPVRESFGDPLAHLFFHRLDSPPLDSLWRQRTNDLSKELRDSYPQRLAWAKIHSKVVRSTSYKNYHSCESRAILKSLESNGDTSPRRRSPRFAVPATELGKRQRPGRRTSITRFGRVSSRTLAALSGAISLLVVPQLRFRRGLLLGLRALTVLCFTKIVAFGRGFARVTPELILRLCRFVIGMYNSSVEGNVKFKTSSDRRQNCDED